MYERALLLRRDVLGERHAETIISLSNLAGLLAAQGDLQAARPMYERAPASSAARPSASATPKPSKASTTWGPCSRPRVISRPHARCSNGLLELSREVQGERHPRTMICLGNLASLLQAEGDLQAARPMFERVLELSRAVLGERHHDTIMALSNLAGLLVAQGELSSAGPMYGRALQLRRETLGERHPDTIHTLNNLAIVRQNQHDFTAARPIFEEALKLRGEVLGERHPDTIISLTYLAASLVAQGQPRAARPLAGRALVAAEGLAFETLPALTEREQVAYLASVRQSLDLSLALSDGDAGSDGDAYRHVLAWKGLTGQAAAARAAGRSPEAGKILADLVPLRGRLNAMHFARVPPDKTAEHARGTRALADQVAHDEAELARAVGWTPAPPRTTDVAAALPPGVAFVDILRYRHSSRSERGRSGLHSESRYVAFVIRPLESPERVELGPAAPIEEALNAWRARLQAGDDAEEMGRQLAGLVWAPLAKHLGDIRTVLVSPDRQLSFLPWAALPDDEPGSFLIRRYAFGTLVSARQLTELAKPGTPPAAGGLLAVGGVDYGRADASPSPAGVAVASRSAAVDRDSVSFDPLPGTAAEVHEVAELYERATLGRVEGLSGSAATKERLRAAMVGRRHLHLATHGFFAPPKDRSVLAPDDAPTDLKPWQGMSRGEVRGFYPGLLSGLVWAGAAHPPRDKLSGVEDLGSCLMTAEEVASIDLKGCELAVLSACETGLGATAGGEGVKGLQSAFHSAGCRTVVASLWRVDDAATRSLMSRFYANLWQKKQPAIEALRNAQLGVLDDPEYGDSGNPRLWAAWVLSGDPGRPSEIASAVKPTKR